PVCVILPKRHILVRAGQLQVASTDLDEEVVDPHIQNMEFFSMNKETSLALRTEPLDGVEEIDMGDFMESLTPEGMVKAAQAMQMQEDNLLPVGGSPGAPVAIPGGAEGEGTAVGTPGVVEGHPAGQQVDTGDEA